MLVGSIQKIFILNNMPYEVLPDTPEKKQKKYTIKMPDISGKFGISFCFGKKEIFLGIAIATIQLETVIRRRKQKVLSSRGSAKFIDLS